MRRLLLFCLAVPILHAGDHLLDPMLDGGLSGVNAAAVLTPESVIRNPANRLGIGTIGVSFTPGWRGYGIRGLSLIADPRRPWPVLVMSAQTHEFMSQFRLLAAVDLRPDSLSAYGLSIDLDRMDLLGVYRYSQLSMNAGMSLRYSPDLSFGFSYLGILRSCSGSSSCLRSPDFILSLIWRPVGDAEVLAAVQKQDYFPVAWRWGIRKSWYEGKATAVTAYDTGTSSLIFSITVSFKGKLTYREVFQWHPLLQDLHGFSFSWSR